MRVDVFPMGLDLKVSAIWPTQLKSLEWTVERGRPSPVSFVSDLAGTYRLKVRPQNPKEGSGSYKIKVLTIRKSTVLDQRYVTACRLLSEAQDLRHKSTGTSLRAAIKKYQQAAEIWREVQDKSEEAWTLNSTGDLFAYISEYQKALGVYQECLRLWKSIDDRKGETRTLNGITSVHMNIGENKKALEVCTRALNQSRDISDLWEEAQALDNMGYLYFAFGDMKSATEFLNKTLELRRSLQDVRARQIPC